MSYLDLYLSSSPKITLGDKGSRIFIMGAPYDLTTSYRPGSRFAPDQIRSAFWNIEIVDRKLGANAEEIGIFDLGNLSITTNVNRALDMIEKASGEVFSQGKVLGTLGGEHLITYPLVKKIKDAALVVFDAHLDLRDELYGLTLSHATFLRRLTEERRDLKVYHFGSHTFVDEEINYARERGIEVVTSYELREKGIKSIGELIKEKNVYVSVDVDVLDPSCAPGVANPEPEGLNYSELFDLIRSLCCKNIMGFDIVEVNPAYDPSGITAVAAAKILSLLIILAADGACRAH